MTISGFNTGDVFRIPHDAEFGEDFFVVTGTSPFMGHQILDAMCEGAEDIQITVNSRDVEKVE